ncbi:hypothetical protein ACVWZL_000973 [Bradyrhizobium sp. GM2.4]
MIHTQYEAVDQKAGGHFILWSEREKIFYGLDQKLFPGARFVDITQVTPSVGSITLTYVEVRSAARRRTICTWREMFAFASVEWRSNPAISPPAAE